MTRKSTSPAKAAAARENGRKGGRPPKKRELCWSCGKFHDEVNDACVFGHPKKLIGAR